MASLLKSTSIVSSMTLVSRVMGFMRDMIVAQIFGAHLAFDAFVLAFKIPNFFRRLFAEGAFSQAFVPVLSEYKTCASQEETQLFISRVGGNLILILFLFTVVGVLSAPLIVSCVAPGLEAGERHVLTVRLLRITFPYIFLISLTAFFGGILNAYGRFTSVAFGPVLLNVALIFAAVVLRVYFDLPIVALAWGVILGGVLQLGFQWFFLRRMPIKPRFTIHWQDKGVNRVLKLMLPAFLGGGVMQINLFVSTFFVSYLPVGSVSWVYYSDRLLELPLGVLGVALTTVILPHLSRHYAVRSEVNFSNSIDWALRWTCLMGSAATVGLIMLAPAIMTTLFYYGAFSEQAVRMSSMSLRTLSIGLIAFIMVKVLVSAFYARQNTKFPAYIAILSIILNVLFSILLIRRFAHAGLTLSLSLASIINVGVLLTALLRAKIYQWRAGWMGFMSRLLIANGLMILFLWNVTPEFDSWLAFSLMERVRTLGFLILGGGSIYLAGLVLTGIRVEHLQLETVYP